MYTPKVICYRITKKKGQELSYKEVYYMILFYKIKGKKRGEKLTRKSKRSNLEARGMEK